MPHRDGTIALTSACWNRDFATAWFRTPTQIDSEERRWWWSLTCNRDRHSWSCEQPQRQQRIEVRVAAEDREVSIIASFPETISTVRAKALVATAATLAMKQKLPLPACFQGNDDTDRWRLARVDPPPSADLDYPAVSLETASTGSVIDFNFSLEMYLDQDDAPTCWQELITVT